MSNNSDEDPSCFSTTVDADTDEDPSDVTYNWSEDKSAKISVKDVWKKSPWVSNSRFWYLRTYFLLCQVADIVVTFISICEWFLSSGRPGDLIFDPFICLFAHFVNLVNIPMHTITVSVIGFDKIYLTHLFLHAFERTLAFMLASVVAIKGRRFSLWEIYTPLYLITFLVWSVPTRLLYLQTYRDSWKFFRMDEDYLFKKLLVPWIILGGCCYGVFIYELVGPPKIRKQVLLMAGWFAFALACLLFFEIYMYIVLDPKKTKLHLCNCHKTNMFEKVYCFTIITCLICFVVCLCLGHIKFDKFESLNQSQLLSISLVFLWIFLMNARHVVLWHHAVGELKKSLIRACIGYTGGFMV